MKIKIFFVALFMSLLVSVAGVFADEVTPITTLQEFKNSKATPGNYRLDADIALTGNTSITADGYMLDLNGHTLNVGAKTLLAYGNITIKDSSTGQTGKITANSSSPRTIQVGSSTTQGKITLESGTIEGVGTYALWLIAGSTAAINGGTVVSDEFAIINIGEVTVDGGTVLSTGNGAGAYYGQSNSTLTLNSGKIQADGRDAYSILLSKPGSTMTMNGGEVLALNNGGVGIGAFKDTAIMIHGGTVRAHDQAICGNGSVSGSNEGTNMKVTITGGEIISDTATAIYIPQPNGETNISGGTVTGETAIEIRAGKLNISGGTFNGGSEPYSITGQTSGSAAHNVAIAAVQHTTKLPLEVNITGGTFNANLPFVEANPLGNPQEALDKISIQLGSEDGEAKPVFNASGDTTILSEDKTAFIYSGLYTHDLNNGYIAEDRGEIDEGAMNAVYPYHEVVNEIPSDFPGGTVEVSAERTLRGSLVTIKATPAPGYYVDEIIVTDADGNRIPIINGNQFYAPNSNVGIHVVFGIANPATSDNGADYIPFLIICSTALICSISSFLLARKMATIASRHGE